MSRQDETEILYKLLANVVHICRVHGIKHVVLSPGSRSAPLALSFIRYTEIKHWIITDERSAAYTALGIAKQLLQPVAVVCTSGTAALNLAPAIAEAYFSEIPLVVLTADRPPEWIGQADNQSIHQQELYGRHVKASFGLPVDFIHPDAGWHALRIINEALLLAKSPTRGPVHINFPFREPFYADTESVVSHNMPKVFTSATDLSVYKIDKKAFENELLYKLHGFKKILVVAGMYAPSEKLRQVFHLLSKEHELVFLPDITSNLHGLDYAIDFYDLALSYADEKTINNLKPELLITFGGPLVSKNLKQFLRCESIKEHWHISESGTAADTFQKLTKIVAATPEDFFAELQNAGFLGEADYYRSWQQANRKIRHYLESFYFRLPYSESRAMMQIMQALPEGSVLHLGNSLPVRHASVFPLIRENIMVYSNRGTSGIDGSLSTAAGQSLVFQEATHTLICGDLSFMYDRNGLWNNYLKGNFKIIIFNNHGGRIFESLPGAARQKELNEYFVTEQPLNFSHTALQHNCTYLFCNNEEDLRHQLDALFATAERPAILEIEFKDDNTKTASIGEVRNMLKGLINL